MRTRHFEHANGFSLIEVMVALIVISVGMMGIAALHGQSLSAGRTAQFRSVAVNLAADMVDRIRVNRGGEAGYDGPAANNNCTPSAAPPVQCTPAQMAAHDLFVWNQQVQQALPNGQAAVDFDNATALPTYTVTVRWDEVSEQGPVQYQIVFQQPNF